MARPHATTPERRRTREWLGALGVVVMAALSGVVAAHFGSRRAWENPPAAASTTTSIPFVDPQRNP